MTNDLRFVQLTFRYTLDGAFFIGALKAKIDGEDTEVIIASVNARFVQTDEQKMKFIGAVKSLIIDSDPEVKEIGNPFIDDGEAH